MEIIDNTLDNNTLFKYLDYGTLFRDEGMVYFRIIEPLENAGGCGRWNAVNLSSCTLCHFDYNKVVQRVKGTLEVQNWEE